MNITEIQNLLEEALWDLDYRRRYFFAAKCNITGAIQELENIKINGGNRI